MARRRHAVAAFAAVTAITAAACNLLTGLDEDYGLAPTDPTPDAPLPDNAAPEADQSAPDAVAPLSSFCVIADAGPYGFCEDFEDASVVDGLPARWTRIHLLSVTDASVTVTEEAGTDGSTGVVVESRGLDGGRQTYLAKVLDSIHDDPGTFLGYEVSYDFIVDVSQLDYAALGTLTFPTAVPGQDHGVALYPGNVAGRLTPREAGVPLEEKWHHVVIRLEHAAPAAPFTRTITIDGTRVDDTSGHMTSPATTSEVRLGIFYTSANTTNLARVRFDNVLVRRW